MDKDTQRRRPWKDHGRHRSDRSLRTATDCRPPPEVGQAKEDPVLESSVRVWPCQALDVRRLVSRRCQNTFLLFQTTQSVVLCYGSPHKPIQGYFDYVYTANIQSCSNRIWSYPSQEIRTLLQDSGGNSDFADITILYENSHRILTCHAVSAQLI